MNVPKVVLFRQYRTLDAIVVVYALSVVALIVWALIFRTIRDNQLAILAGLAGTVIGIVSGYCAARWGTPSQQVGGGQSEPTGTSPEPVVVTPPSGGSAVTPPTPQMVEVLHSFVAPAAPDAA